MFVSLISPLSIDKCISLLEEAGKKETVSFASEFTPPRCEVKGKTFTLRKNYYKNIPFMQGNLSETREGTLITYSMEIDSVTRLFNSIWITAALPLTFCFVVSMLTDGFTKGFSWNLLFVLFMAIAIPGFYYLQKYLGERKSEIDKKEMIEFLQTVLEAKPKMP